MILSEGLDWVARSGLAFYFLWAVGFNLKTIDHNIAELKRVGVWPAKLAFYAALVAQATGGVLLLIPHTVVYGAAILIGFTAAVDFLFHRYWTYADPKERVSHRFFLFQHIAIMGGLLALISTRI